MESLGAVEIKKLKDLLWLKELNSVEYIFVSTFFSFFVLFFGIISSLAKYFFFAFNLPDQNFPNQNFIQESFLYH